MASVEKRKKDVQLEMTSRGKRMMKLKKSYDEEVTESDLVRKQAHLNVLARVKSERWA